MKFKTYLQEKNNSSDKIMRHIFNFDIPLSPKVFEDIFGTQEGIYFHTTSYTNLLKMKNLQGTRKGISTFNRWDDKTKNDIFAGANGMENVFPITFVLKGKYSINANQDIYTNKDSQGRRWVVPYNIDSGPAQDILEKIQDVIEVEFLKKYSDIIKQNKKSVIDIINNIDTKTKGNLIKDYMDISTKVIKKFKNGLIQLRQKDLVGGYNEMIGYDFKIIDILIDTAVYTELEGQESQDLETEEYSKLEAKKFKKITKDFNVTSDVPREAKKYK